MHSAPRIKEGNRRSSSAPLSPTIRNQIWGFVMLSVLSLVLTVPRPTLVDLPAMVPTTASHAQHWRSAAVNVLLESEGDTGISTVDLPWITAAAANCTHAASCLTHIPGGEWDRILAEQRYQMQIAPPPFICDNIRHGLLTYITRECSPAENATGGTGQLLVTPEEYPDFVERPVKREALYCGNPYLPWGVIRADKVDEPVFDLCTQPSQPCYRRLPVPPCIADASGLLSRSITMRACAGHSSPPGGAYLPTGVCGRHSSRELLLGVMLLRHDQATAARIGLFGLDPELDVSKNTSIGLMNGMQAAALDCVGGWVDAALFECQHCPGSCNDDLPGGYEWSTTPSSFDGSLVYDQMFMATPKEFVEYACTPPFYKL